MLSLDEAEEILKRGTFRLCLGKHRDETGLLTDFYGTGFFVGLKGEALTANHNFEDCSPDGTFEAVYKGHQIFLKWIREKSSEVSDIAFMRLHANPDGVGIEPLRAAYLDPTLSLAARRDFFKDSCSVVSYGYPQRGRSGEGWRIDGAVDTGLPIIDSHEGTGEPVMRLSIRGSRITELEGISGAAVFDRGSEQVIAVVGSYDVQWVETVAGRQYWKGAGDVRGSEIGLLVSEHPELARYFERISPREQKCITNDKREISRRVQRQIVAPVGMVSISEGGFWMGSPNDDQEAETDERPRHRVWIDEFFIDEAPTTNRQYADFLKATGHRRPKCWRDSRFNSPEQPVVGVSWDDAEAYAKWAGKRLLTEAEWEKAARGGLEGMTYPWGSEDPCGRACFGLNAEQGSPDPVKRYPPNAYGVYDVAGLVAEWVADWYEGGYYMRSSSSNPQGPATGEHRVVRGGAWNFPKSTLRSARRDALVPSSCYGSLGFRCAKNPPQVS